jgi:hypothetical protein
MMVVYLFRKAAPSGRRKEKRSHPALNWQGFWQFMRLPPTFDGG